MTSLKATDVALEGFRVTRENPRTFLIWCGFSLASSIIGALTTIALGDEAREALAAISGQEQASAEALFKALETIAPLFVLGLVTQSMIAAAVFRIILRHSDHGFGYLKLGMDELRLGVVTLICYAGGFLLLSLLTIPAGLIAVLLQGILGSGAAIFLGVVIVFVAAAWVGARLCLAPAITFTERRISIFQSWALTRDNGWKLAGAYGLAFSCYATLLILLMMVVWLLAAVSVGGNLQAVPELLVPTTPSFESYLKPWTLIYLALNAPVSVFSYCVFASPSAVAYLALRREDPTIEGGA